MTTALKSRTVLVIALMFVIGGVQALEGIMPTELFLFINAGLSYLAMYFKLNPSQEYKIK